MNAKYTVIFIVAILALLLAACGAAPAGAPEAVTESGGSGAPAAPAEVPGATTFDIVPAESEARFFIDELLRGQPNTVVGRTDRVAGSIAVDPASPASAQVGVIRVDAGTLATDSSRRDGAIDRWILQTDQYQFVEFAPTAIDGLPDSVSVGEPFTVQITGDLTVRNITRPVTFETTVTPVSDARLEGSAVTTIRRGDFDLTIPNVPLVADVSEEVRLEIDFVAVAN